MGRAKAIVRGKRSKNEDDSPCEEVQPSRSLRGRNKKIKTEPVEEELDVEVENKPLAKSSKKDKSSNKKKPLKEIKKEEPVDEELDIEVENEKVKKDKSSNKKKPLKEIKKEYTEKKAVERTLIKKNAAAVDGICPVANSTHIFCEDDEVWDCMLNQTNIQFNNNKYYIIQLLKDDNKDSYYVWMRWGRVGCTGQNCLKPFQGNLDGAKNVFEKKFSDKTRNEWAERDSFEKVPGKYDLLKMDYSDGKDEVDHVKREEGEKPIKKVDSKLEEKVKALVELICDVKAMEAAVVEMKYDAKKAPLGKLTSDQVKAGYVALKEIENIIMGTEKSANKKLLDACNAFYTRIPHYFGMKVPPLIRTKQEIIEKMNLLQALGDIEAAMSIINQTSDVNLHPADQHYNGLECHIETLDKEHSEYKVIEKYLTTTHGKTHTMYKMKLLDIFKVSKASEETRFKDVGNRMLLWHGSRLTNWAGILSKGLRIAPPEAPSTGYMFGKGIYFADMASKSANYCMPNYQNKTGILVLCDVALGKSNELHTANYTANKLPKGFHSVKGVGQTSPDPKNFTKLSDDVVVPMGPARDTKNDGQKCYLQYNEYIVYDVSQVKIKYLVKVEFKF